MAIEQMRALEQLRAVQYGRRDAFARPPRDERIEALIRALQLSPYFEDIEDVVLEKFASASVVHRYRKNQVLFVEGDRSDSLYFVMSGRVKVYRLTYDGRERIVHMLGSGEFLGMTPFCDGGTYAASAEIADDADIALIRRESFRAIAESHVSLLFGMLKFFAKRLRQAQDDSHDLALKSAPARLAGRLLDLADSFGEITESGVEFDLKLNREELGNLVGTSRETATKVLRQFEQERIIRLEGTTVTIVKPFILQSLSMQ